MADGILWDYCKKCGRKIVVGETCYDTGNDSYCTDCCKIVNTKQGWSDRFKSEVEYAPIVRCKDCKWYKPNPYGEESDLMCQFWADWLPTEDDDFCSYGERRSDG